MSMLGAWKTLDLFHRNLTPLILGWIQCWSWKLSAGAYGCCFVGQTFPPQREKSDGHEHGQHLTHTSQRAAQSTVCPDPQDNTEGPSGQCSCPQCHFGVKLKLGFCAKAKGTPFAEDKAILQTQVLNSTRPPHLCRRKTQDIGTGWREGSREE